MPASRMALGSVLMVRMPTHDPAGHEQQGLRPAVVVGIPTPPVRYPMVMVVPLTSKLGEWQNANPTLYPVLSAGSGGIPRLSVALVDQCRTVDPSRILSELGTLLPAECVPIYDGLRAMMGQRDRSDGTDCD